MNWRNYKYRIKQFRRATRLRFAGLGRRLLAELIGILRIALGVALGLLLFAIAAPLL